MCINCHSIGLMHNIFDDNTFCHVVLVHRETDDEKEDDEYVIIFIIVINDKI